jgi:hypothetical protein
MSAEPLDIEVVFARLPWLADDDPLAPVQRLVGRVRSEYATLPAPEPRGELRAWLGDDTSARAVGVVSMRSIRRDEWFRRRQHRVLVLVAAIAAAIFVTAGLALAGVLPGPAQRVAHDLFDRVGIDVPSGHSSSSRGPGGVAPSVNAGGSGAGASVGAPGARPPSIPAAGSAVVPDANGLSGGDGTAVVPALPVPPVPLALPPVALAPVPLPPVAVPPTVTTLPAALPPLPDPRPPVSLPATPPPTTLPNLPGL